MVTSFALALFAAVPLAAQRAPALPVPVEGLAGQQVALVPLTLVATDPAAQPDTVFAPLKDRRATLTWADSLIGEAFVGRAPEVNWVLPPALRKIARRSPGIVDDPDQMGQAMLRATRLREVPDPLRSSLRTLMAVGRRQDRHGAGRAQLFFRHDRRRAGRAVSRGRRQPLGQGALAERCPGHRPDARPGAWRGAQRRSPPSMTYDVTLIPGDGIGPEITAQTVRVLEASGLRFNWDEELAGMSAVEATGTPLPDATVESIRKNALALKGPLTTPVGTGFRSVNVGLRKEFELYANVRPARTIVPGGRFENVDIVLVRENLEGLYIGVEHFVQIGDDPRAVAESMAIVTRAGCERIIRYAFEYALRHGRKKVTIVHKANILKMVSGLFLEVGRAVAKEYEGRVTANDMIVDNTAMQLVMRPEQFDVMVTTNMFGDILSDEVSGLVGGLGLAPGANIGTKAAIFEAVHGSAPDIAGQGVANPSAQMLAAAMMLDHMGELDRAQRLRDAVRDTIVTDGIRTRDLGGTASTEEFGRAVARRVA
jgi:isocitrate dehydrogenase (NAD+)